jgi:two-component system invasion response regulator UvrY
MRVILADGESNVRSALKILLTQDLDTEVVGEADTFETLQRQVRDQRPELAIVAWNLVAADGRATLEAVRALSPGLRIVVLGLRPETRTVALDCGADAFVSKVDSPAEVALAVSAAWLGASPSAGQSPTSEHPVKVRVRGTSC